MVKSGETWSIGGAAANGNALGNPFSKGSIRNEASAPFAMDEGFVVAGEQVEDVRKGIEAGDAERDDLMAQLERLSGPYALGDFRRDGEKNLRRDGEADHGTLQEMAKQVDREVQEAEDLLRRIKRQPPWALHTHGG